MERLDLKLKAIWAAVKLGWAIESNWTDPFIFIVYQVVRPLFAAAILVVMVRVVTGEPTSSLTVAHLYVGSAFFYLVLQSILTIGFTVMMDRERFQMIRYIYLAPLGFGPYLAARGASQVLAAIAGIVVTLGFGIVVFGLPIALPLASAPYFLTVFILGGLATLSLGVSLASLSLVLANHGYEMPDGMIGVLFLISGAVFSIDVLPGPVAAVAKFLPWTWWLEALRRTLLDQPFIGSLAHYSNSAVLGMLSVSALGMILVGWGMVRGCTYLAIASGKLDQRTDH